MVEPMVPQNQTLAVEVLTRYAALASADFLIGVILASSDDPVRDVLRAELDRRLALLKKET